jgi:hypothetical protein
MIVVAVSTMAFEQAASALRQRHGPLAPVERDASDQPVVAPVAMVVVARAPEVAFRRKPQATPKSRRSSTSPMSSPHSLPLSVSPPSGKLLIPLERRDVRVV